VKLWPRVWCLVFFTHGVVSFIGFQQTDDVNCKRVTCAVPAWSARDSPARLRAVLRASTMGRSRGLGCGSEKFTGLMFDCRLEVRGETVPRNFV